MLSQGILIFKSGNLETVLRITLVLCTCARSRISTLSRANVFPRIGRFSLFLLRKQWRIYKLKVWSRHPRRVKILSISCSFGDILAKSYVGTPRKVGAPTEGKSWIRHCQGSDPNGSQNANNLPVNVDRKVLRNSERNNCLQCKFQISCPPLPLPKKEYCRALCILQLIFSPYLIAVLWCCF